MYSDRDILIGMENTLGIRLQGVELGENAQIAHVTFEFIADGYTVGEPRKILTHLVLEVARFKKDSGATDFDTIVSTAAKRMQDDVGKISTTLENIQTAHPLPSA